MPKAFKKCVKRGGRVRRLTPKKGRYLNVCFPRGGGPSKRGEVKRAKTSKR